MHGCVNVGNPGDQMVVDAKDYGNVARFMNHSCDGNLIKKVKPWLLLSDGACAMPRTPLLNVKNRYLTPNRESIYGREVL